MADYISQGAFEPSIPKHLVTEKDLKVLNAFGLTITPDGEDKLSLFADDWCTSGYVEDDDGKELELSEDDLYACLQGIIRRSNGELLWLSKETAYTCTRNLSDGFGGSAVFVTIDDIQFFSTSSWLEQRIHEAETGDIGPETEDSYLPLLREVFQALTTDDAENSLDIETLRRCAADTSNSAKLARIAWKIHQAIGSDTKKDQDGPCCQDCDSNLELSSTDTLFGIDREIYRCPDCEGRYIKELASSDSLIEKAVKCVGCGSMIVKSTARIFYQSDDLAHYIGECCRDERLRP